MNRTPLFLAAFLATLIGTGSSAFAHPGHGLPLEDLARIADLVVEGRVTEVASEWTPDRRQIYTTVALQVARYHKGGETAGTFRFRYLGGTVGEITLAVLGQPAFGSGERVFLFMNPDWRSGRYPVVSGEHGKFTVGTDPSTGREVLVNEGGTLTKTQVTATLERIRLRGR